jgi:hypothetical protein
LCYGYGVDFHLCPRTTARQVKKRKPPHPRFGYPNYFCLTLQFIIISLRNNMFELADRLVGIYKTDNTTKTVAINPSQFVMPEIAAPPSAAAAAAGAVGGKENNQHQGPQPMAVA